MPLAIELPAVVNAADTVLLVASPEEVGSAMSATGSDDADFAIGLTKGDELLTKKLDRRSSV